MIDAGWRLGAEICGWGLAAIWGVRTRTLYLRLGRVPDLSAVEWDLCPARSPELLVVVPAKDEVEAIGPAMETLLAQDYRPLRVAAVDDRSTDGTGTVLDSLAAKHPAKLEVVHITEPAEGWMGKTFAMAVGADQRRQSEYILFTDADVWFSPSVLRRAVAYAEIVQADHLAIMPTPVTETWGERTILAFVQVFTLWVASPWRVGDPAARWSAAAGACSLVRRDALEELGGLAPQRSAVLPNLTLGWRMRAAGMRQQVAFAPGLVLEHRGQKAKGAWELTRSMARSCFALAGFRVFPLLGTMAAIAILFLLPMVELAWVPTMLPGIFVLVCMAVWYQRARELSGIPARYGWLQPLGVAAVLWAMLRSVAVTLWRRGVLWHGTFYPVSELRGHNSLFVWQWEAAKLRAEKRKVERGTRAWALHRRPGKLTRRGVHRR